MAVVMVTEVPGADAGMVEGMRQAGMVEAMEAAPGFRGHWGGATGSGYRLIELRTLRRTGRLGMTATSCRTFHPAPSRHRRSSSS